MKTTRSNICDSRALEIKGMQVICYRNKFGNAPIAWMVKTQGEWSTWPMTKHTIRGIIEHIQETNSL
jgi:hypothetical protein